MLLGTARPQTLSILPSSLPSGHPKNLQLPFSLDPPAPQTLHPPSSLTPAARGAQRGRCCCLSQQFPLQKIPTRGQSHLEEKSPRGPARAALNPRWPLAQKQRPLSKLRRGPLPAWGLLSQTLMGWGSLSPSGRGILPLLSYLAGILSPDLEFGGGWE